MTASLVRSAIVIACTTLAGCAGFNAKEETVATAETVKQGPESKPYRLSTGFSSGLRCMDNMMIFYGVKDVSMLVEDLVDTTKKVNAGMRDMLVSAVSDMTKRGEGIRLVPFGNDVGNLAAYLDKAESRGPYAVIPLYDIRGSISQLDETVAQKQVEGAINIGPVGGGFAKTATALILGIDLSVISTADFSMIPGVTARNAVIFYKEGRGYDAELEYKKFGVSWGMTVTKSEGQAQALRTLVELSMIELLGRLTKTPYWKCLNVNGDNEEVANEVADWFYALSNKGELVLYMQKQLRMRGYYAGPIDGVSNPQFSAAVAQSRSDLGQSEEPKLDLEYFGAFLDSQRKAEVPATAAKAEVAHRLALAVATARGGQAFKGGELFDIVVKPSRNAYVYCYLRDENEKITRFYPNRFRNDALVSADTPLALPGKMGFQLIANDKGVRETVACFATEREVLPELPGIVAGVDFETLPVSSLDQIRNAFARVAGEKLAEGILHVEVR
jgi:Domain of unknown function (DUF4384)